MFQVAGLMLFNCAKHEIVGVFISDVLVEFLHEIHSVKLTKLIEELKIHNLFYSKTLSCF